ncbi:MAG: hypothetical protein ACE3JK_18395 [Sporolactobacillus sp.]
MKTKKTIILSSIIIIILLIGTGVAIHNFNARNQHSNWIGKTKDGNWVAELHYSKAQKSYTGIAFWRGSRSHFNKITHLKYKYFEDGKVMTSTGNGFQNISNQYFSFIDFDHHPSTPILSFTYAVSGIKHQQSIKFHSSSYHYTFFKENISH